MKLISVFFVTGMLINTLSACSPEKDKVLEVIHPVKLMNINVVNKKELRFPGKVKASKEAKLAFRIPGQIQQYHIHSGQMIKKGELLVELDPTDYQYKLQAQQANLDLANITLERNAVLIKDFLISQEDYDTSKSNMQVAESNYKIAKANLAHTKIYMPYDGVIANTYKESFEFVQAQEVVLSIQSDGAIDVVIDVPERLISGLRTQYNKGSVKTKVSFPLNLGQEYDVSFKDISTIADKNTGSYEVTLTLPSPKNINLYSGMSATGIIQVNYEVNLDVHIPESAFMRKDGQTMLWRYLPDSNGLEKITIATSQESEIITLLSSGDQIVIAGVNALSEKMKVKPWYKERGL